MTGCNHLRHCVAERAAGWLTGRGLKLFAAGGRALARAHAAWLRPLAHVPPSPLKSDGIDIVTEISGEASEGLVECPGPTFHRRGATAIVGPWPLLNA